MDLESNHDTVDELGESRWYVDVDWLEASGRSFAALVRGSLCPDCLKRLDADRRDVPAAEVLATIKDCCSGKEDYIHAELPILESIFRVFLLNGSEPLDLIELGRQLSERRGVDTYRTSVAVLSRLLRNDRYYGFTEVVEERPPEPSPPPDGEVEEE